MTKGERKEEVQWDGFLFLFLTCKPQFFLIRSSRTFWLASQPRLRLGVLLSVENAEFQTISLQMSHLPDWATILGPLLA